MYLQYSIGYDFYGLMVFDSGIIIMAQNVYIFKIIEMCLAKSILKSSMNCLCCHHADKGKMHIFFFMVRVGDLTVTSQITITSTACLKPLTVIIF